MRFAGLNHGSSSAGWAQPDLNWDQCVGRDLDRVGMVGEEAANPGRSTCLQSLASTVQPCNCHQQIPVSINNPHGEPAQSSADIGPSEGSSAVSRPNTGPSYKRCWVLTQGEQNTLSPATGGAQAQRGQLTAPGGFNDTGAGSAQGQREHCGGSSADKAATATST